MVRGGGSSAFRLVVNCLGIVQFPSKADVERTEEVERWKVEDVMEESIGNAVLSIMGSGVKFGKFIAGLGRHNAKQSFPEAAPAPILLHNAHFLDYGCRFGPPLTLFLTPLA